MPSCKSIYVEPITHDEIIKLITSLDCKKSCGPDGISPQLLKDNKYLFTNPLQYIYNLSLTSGVVPDKMKLAKVIPIYKKGAKNSAGNYRPISLLNLFNKLLEKIIHKRLFCFLCKQHFFYNYQFGFRQKHSTSLALLEVMDMCYQNLDSDQKIVAIFFDLQKAFDTVDHPILLQKLYNSGIRGVMYNWVNSYLSNRKQYTVVNGVIFDLGNVSCGVPQGSVLGPLLFLIYVNDIHKAVPDGNLKLFADDTNLFLSGSNLQLLEKQANECLKNMEDWFIANKLTININKTFYMIYSGKNKKKKDVELKLMINGHVINKVSSCKYLGVHIDDLAKWNIHIDYLYNKLIKFTSIFFRIRSILPWHCLHKLYYAFVYPHISYGIEVYANTSCSVLDKLCKLNNKLLRILLSANFETPVIELYNSFRLLPIPLLYESKMLIFMFNSLHNSHNLPEVFKDYFKSNSTVHKYNTRQSSNLHLDCVSSNVGQRQTKFYASKCWNSLPQELKEFTNISSFKKNIRKYLLCR